MHSNKKRVILIGLFFLVLSSILTLAISNLPSLNLNQEAHASLGKYMDPGGAVCYCNHGPTDDCWYDNDGLYDHGKNWDYVYDCSGLPGPQSTDPENLILPDPEFRHRCGDDEGPEAVGINVDVTNLGDGKYLNVPEQQGCWFVLEEQDEVTSNEKGWARIKEGFIFDHNWRVLCYQREDSTARGPWCYDMGGGSDAQYGLTGAHYRAAKDGTLSYICSDDQFWHTCNEGNAGTVTWAKNILFNCTTDENNNILWQRLDFDYDGDGYTQSQGDCANTPDDLRVQQAGCPEFGHPEDCVLPRDSRCAICINPIAPEICGDGIGSGVNDPTDGLGNDCNDATDDNCDNFKEGCNQDTIEPTEGPDGIVATFQDHGNVFDSSFPWVQTGKEGEGFCCGFKGVDDIGKKVKGTESASGEFICLPKKDTGLTGTELDEVPGGDLFCKDDWCLANAIGVSPAGGKFNILTINKPGEKSYDIVSNGEEWFTCDANNLGEFKKTNYPQQGLDTEEAYGIIRQINNRLYCYNEGDHYAWAECAGDLDKRKNKEIKGRYPGEGLFSLPLDVGETIGEIRSSVGGFIDINSFKYYTEFYGENHLLDFSGYDYFSLMVQFCTGGCTDAEILTLEQLQKEKLLPLDITLTFNGPNKEVLFEKQILSDITNGPIEDSKWLHIKTKIPQNILAIKSVLLQSHPSTIEMRVRNVYLSKEEDKTQLCSGLDSADENSWLDDIDKGTSQSNIVGKDLCTTLYGDNSWLGKDNDLTSGFANANCCGDDPNEYYVGKTKENDNGAKFACWNSKTIADKGTVMDVEFDVEWKELVYSRTEEEIAVKDLLLDYYTEPFLEEELTSKEIWEWGDDPDNLVSESRLYADEFGADQFCIEMGYTSAKSYKEEACVKNPKELIATYYTPGERENYSTLNDFGWYSEYCGPGEFGSLNSILTEVICQVDLTSGWNNIPNSTNINLQEPLKIIAKISPSKIASPNYLTKFGLTINSKQDDRIELEAYSTVSFQKLGTFENGKLTISPKDIVGEDAYYSSILIVAKLNLENVNFDISSQLVSNISTFSYPCNAEECLYPVPGIPAQGITIENLHPNLYDLYYLYYQDDEVKEKFIEKKETFYQPGNIVARKVSQQIVFSAEANETTEDPKFYGCQAADFIKSNNKISILLEDKGYCSIQADQFCSPSVNKEAVGSQDSYTLINSWSDEQLEKVGYVVQESETDDLSTYFANLVLELKDASPFITPSQRNHTSTIVPVRNFVPNAEFRYSGVQIPHWEIIKGDKVILEEKAFVDVYTYSIKKLSGNEVLRSEKISVNQSNDYYFQHNGTAKTTITLFDNNGKETEKITNTKLSEPFNSKNATFLIIEFNQGTVQQPSLQLVDSLGIGNDTFVHKEYPDLFDFRTGIACCPENYCWNGYTCAEPMQEMSMMTEHFGVGRDYRCIKGEWTALPIKWDWNNDKWGFCSEENQCFITSEGSATFTSEDFYDGNMPICVNTSEYILDHYCEDGNWSTRTKYLSSKLAEFAQNDEYIIYCTNYREALLDFNPELYLGGECFATDEQKAGLEETFLESNGPESLQNCFCELMTEEGKRLVPSKDNNCINNVCVVKYKESGAFKTAFGTTLNKNISDPDSFLLALGVQQQDLAEVCSGEGDLIECNFENNIIWYIPKLNAVVYGKEGIQLSGTVGQKIVDFFKDLFGIETAITNQSKFVKEAQNFNEIYLLSKDGKKVTAIKEVYPGKKQTLVAQYENFETPVCSYVEHLEVPLELQTELLEDISDMKKLECSQEGSIQKVQMIAGLDYFWPQLTGKLRVGEMK